METASPVPKKARYYEFDVLRAICVLALPFVHIADECRVTYSMTKATEIWFHAVLSLVFGVTCFVALFGANLGFASKKTPGEYFKRGVKFLIIGVVLNLCRFAIPYFIFSNFSGDIDPMLLGPPLVLTSDIYDYFGAFLILYSLFVKLGLSKHAMLAITLALHLLALPLIGLSSGNAYLDLFLGRIYSVNDLSFFPLMVWSFVPILGLYVSDIYSAFKDEEARKKGLKKGLVQGLIALAACFAALALKGDSIWLCLRSEFSMTPLPMATYLSLALAAGSAVCLLYYAARDSRAVKFLIKISNVVMPFYFLHFVIVCWLEISGIAILGKDFVLNLPLALLASVFAFFASVFLSLRFGEKLNRLLR